MQMGPGDTLLAARRGDSQDFASPRPFPAQRESARERSFEGIVWPHSNSQLTPARLAAAVSTTVRCSAKVEPAACGHRDQPRAAVGDVHARM